MSVRKLGALACGMLAAVIGPREPLSAQGLNVYTHSACMLARAAAGVADPCADGSAVFYSPAALAFQPNAAALGVIGVQTWAEFTFDAGGATFESTQPLSWVPHLFASVRAGPRLAAAIGAFAPYGLKTRWPLDFEGRYVGYDNEFRSIYIQPTVAYQIVPDRLALGAGVDLVWASVRIDRRLDLAVTTIPGTSVTFAALGVPPGTDFANLRIKGDDASAAFHIGVVGRINDRLRLGARYLHTADLDFDDGTADFTQIATGFLLPAGNPFDVPAGTPVDVVLAPLFAPGGTLSNQRLRTDLTLANQLVIGAWYQAKSRLALAFDYQWTGWHTFDEAPLVFARAPDEVLLLQWKNSSTIRLGADYAATDAFAARGGVYYNTAAVPDVSVSPLLPESARFTLTGGIGYRFAERLRVDAGLEYVLGGERRGRVRPRTQRTQTAAELNVGEYATHALAFGATVVVRFGR